MNNEQFERRMEFIVEQQAQFTVDIQKLKETQEAEAKLCQEKHNDLTDALTTSVGMVGRLAEAQERQSAAQQRTDEQLSELTNKQAETDDRLNALIGGLSVISQETGNRQKQNRADRSPRVSHQPNTREKSKAELLIH